MSLTSAQHAPGIGFRRGRRGRGVFALRGFREGEIVETCRCAKGCPGCVGPPGDVGAYGKDVAKHLLGGLVAAIDATPVPVTADLAPPMTTATV